jgi:hypothetical protein
MRRMTPMWVAAATLAVAGCYWQVTLKTTVGPDGTTERFVSVVGHEAGDLANEFDTPTPTGWTSREVTDKSYAVAGRFRNPATMPSGYVRRVQDAPDTAPSVIGWQTHDRVFYTLYEYKETITDILTPTRFDAAARELIDVGLDVGCLVLERGCGDTYDVQRLTDYVRRDGRPILSALAWTIYEHGLEIFSPDLFGDTAPLRRFSAEVLQPRGLDVDPVVLIRDEVDSPVKRAMVAGAIGDRVRLKSAKDRPLTEKERLKFLEDLESPATGEVFEAVVEEYLTKKYGSREKGEERLDGLMKYLTGAYGNLLGTMYRFEASLRMPGRIMRTSGTLVDEDEVEWRFTGRDVHPRGYVMSAASVVIHEAAQRAVSEKPFVTVRRDVARMEAVLHPLAPPDLALLLKGLRAWVRERSFVSLDEVVSEGGSTLQEAAEAIKAMAGVAKD